MAHRKVCIVTDYSDEEVKYIKDEVDKILNDSTILWVYDQREGNAVAAINTILDIAQGKTLVVVIIKSSSSWISKYIEPWNRTYLFYYEENNKLPKRSINRVLNIIKRVDIILSKDINQSSPQII